MKLRVLALSIEFLRELSTSQTFVRYFATQMQNQEAQTLRKREIRCRSVISIYNSYKLLKDAFCKPLPGLYLKTFVEKDFLRRLSLEEEENDNHGFNVRIRSSMMSSRNFFNTASSSLEELCGSSGNGNLVQRISA